MPVVNNDNTVTFDKATNTFTVKKDYLEQAGLNLWLGQDISELNILRIKYKALGDAGFCLFTEYANDNLDDYDNPWFDRNIYCPSYLTEMVIPLKNGMRKLNSIGFFSMNCVKDEKFIIESVTLEKVSNPVKTNIWASNEPPVIDTATKVTMNEKLTAWDFVPQLGVGYHYQQFLANDPSLDYGLDAYLLWDFPKPSKEGIKFIKEKGFTTVRLQNAPGAYMLDEKYTIDPGYLKALKQCVDWLIEEGLYVILAGPRDDHLQQAQWQGKIGKDVHYACYNVSEKDKAQSKAFLKAVWLQYAQAFNNSYDEHLIFETMDEPAAIFHEHAWNPDDNCATCKKNLAILNEYNQLIVDTIRSTGGNNANRFIMVEAFSGSRYWLLENKLFKLPKDKAENKIIPSLHNYPMPFGRTIYTEGIKKFFITDCFDALDEYFFNKKIPVYFSEIGHPRTIPILERIKCIKDFMVEVRKPNRSCAVSLFDNFNRFEGGTAYDQHNSEWVETEYVDSLLYAAKGKQYLLSSVFTKENEIT
ncbi:MAG: glycoside hydrolase family 5 protein, partial [Spirochaetaceae bacterium]|nr:glycoside hydrolase family 5 protein [Spirochaetaceae bacterium]